MHKWVNQNFSYIRDFFCLQWCKKIRIPCGKLLWPPEGVCEAHLNYGCVHHKYMCMYGGSVLKLALVGKWASSLPFKQHAGTSQKNPWANFWALKNLWFPFSIKKGNSKILRAPKLAQGFSQGVMAHCSKEGDEAHLSPGYTLRGPSPYIPKGF